MCKWYSSLINKVAFIGDSIRYHFQQHITTKDYKESNDDAPCGDEINDGVMDESFDDEINDETIDELYEDEISIKSMWYWL